MKIVVGLGNPGKDYAGTPHNVGFDVVDDLAERLGCRFRRSLRFAAHMAKGMLGNDQLLLVKPQTYMNRSGQAVGAILRYHKVTPDNLVVVLDDADLELGRIRVRPGGGTGGHKGLSSVQEHVGHEQFVRIRLGVGRDRSQSDLVTHVLRPFPKDTQPVVKDMTGRAADAVCCVLESGVADAMNQFNAGRPGTSEHK